MTPATFSSRRAWRLVQRNYVVNSHAWMVIFSGFFEPLFYLVAIGFGIGKLVGQVAIVGGHSVAYPAFVAPAMLATSCVNGAITEGFFNPFFKLHYQGTYDAILATPVGVSEIAMGEVAWGLLRGSLYSAGFLIIMLALHLVLSPWAILALPAAIFISASFSMGALALMTVARSIDDFDKVMNLLVHPMFLFSSTFFPLSVYPPPLRLVVQALPLYQAISLLRALTTGAVGAGTLLNVAYLSMLGIVCMKIAIKRLEQKLVK